MLSVQYRKSVPRYLLVRLLGENFKGLRYGPLSPVQLVDSDPPALPSPRWLRVRTRLAAICGSDLSAIACKGSPYFSPLLSYPFTLGHENLGIVSEIGAAVTRARVGQRIVVEPVLSCEVRNIHPLCRMCLRGDYGLCENVTHGEISPGIQTGYCRDTGGSWAESFVAHESQVREIPDSITDDDAVLIEPFSTALHAVMSHFPEPGETVLVLGCGPIGLMVLQALRAMGATGARNRVIAVARHPFQVELARSYGASDVLKEDGKLYEGFAAATGAETLVPELGKKIFIGGVDRTYDCVGSDASLDDSLRFTRSGGTAVIVGMPSVPKGIDWTSLWYKSLRVEGSYCYGMERCPEGNRRTFDVAIDLVKNKKVNLAPLITHRFPITEYREALKLLFGKKRGSPVLKVALTFS